MGKYKSLAKNSLFVFIGNIGSKAIGFLMLPFYTSWLSVEQYGTIDLVTVYVSLLLPFVSFSLTSAIFAVPVGASKKKQGEYFTIGLLFVSLFISITSILACLAVRICCLHEGVFSQYFVFICVMLYTSFLQTYLQQFCMAIDKMFIFSFTGIVLSGATAIFGFLLIPNGGIEGYLQSIIAANIVTIIVTAVVMKAHEYIRIKNLKISLLKEMLKYSTPMIPNALLWWIIASFNRVTMNQYVGVYYIGLYAIASKLPSILTSLINPLSNAWKLSVIQEYKNDSFNKYYSNVSQVVVMTVALGTIFLGLLSELIIKLITDADYYSSWIYSPILMLSIVFVTLDQMVAPIFMAYRKTNNFLYASMCGALFGVILNYILIPYLGIWGGVISMVGSHAMLSFVQLFLSWKYEKNNSMPSVLIFLIIAVLCNIVLTIFKNYYISILLTIIAAFVYYMYNKKQICLLQSIITQRIKHSDE